MWLVVAALCLAADCTGEVSSIMVSNRLKADARAYMEQHPEISYQEALRAVTAHTPTGASGGTEQAQPDQQHHAVDLFEALGIEDIATHDFAEVWSRNATTVSLRVPYGYRFESGATHAELEYLDLTRESLGGNGPHAAIEGRTGSGKSHFLSSLVLGFAATYAPDTVGFVLANGKGGSTFEGLDKLPHVVAAVSHLENFTPRVQRLVDFIENEMQRRQQLIYAVSGRADFDDYTDRCMQIAESEYPRLPHLLIVLDEYRAAVRSSPGLAPALVHLARTGRALGMHLVVSDQPSDSMLGRELFEQLRTRITLPLDEPLHRIRTEIDAAAQPGNMLAEIASRLSALSNFRAMDQHPLSDEAAQLEYIGFVRAEIDSLIGQDEVKEQLHGILTDALTTAERVRRGLRFSPVHPNFVFTGAPGTGKTHAAQILADTLRAAGAIETSTVVYADRSTLVGRFEGETSAKTAAVFESARNGVLFIDSACDLVQDRDGNSDHFGREAVNTLSQLMRNHVQDTVVVLCGYPGPMRRLLEREQSLAGLFTRRLDFVSPTASELWEYLCRFAQHAGHAVSPEAAEPFQRYITGLADPVRDRDGLSCLDRLGNIRLARNVVEQAARNAAQRLQSVGELSTLSDEELLGLTAEDIMAAVEGFESAAV